jgi:3-hydroxyacyl-CoA dehydrogenase
MPSQPSGTIGYEVVDDIAVLTIDSPPVNALGIDVRRGIVAGVERAADDTYAHAIVLIGAGRTFPAGADIREFDQPLGEPHLLAIGDLFDRVKKPIVAAMHGTALGGGLELALYCHFRVMAAGARVGLPEITLGIFPGAAGTQRLPRLIGVDRALDMITSGQPIDARRALEFGIADDIVEGDLRAEAIAFARKAAQDALPLRITSEPRAGIGPEARYAEVIEKHRKNVAQRMRGQESPLEAIGSVVDGLNMPYDEAVAADRERFRRCVAGDQSKALRYAFFAEREAAKIPDVGRDVSPRPLETAGVVGAGTMGSGIAMSLVDTGIPVTLVETTREALDRGLGIIRRNYEGMVARGRIDQATCDRRLDLITPTLAMDDLAATDVVVEAAFENPDLKKEIFGRLEKVCKPGALLATNTSYLDIDDIAASTGRAEDIIGLHFFVPANVMRLLEVVRAGKSSAEAVATGMALARRLGKVGVPARVSHGFVANRSRAPLVREAIFLVEEGASPTQVDKVLYDFGMPLGPLAVGDMSGLDVSWRMRRAVARPEDSNERYVHLADRLCEMGRFGIKTGKGWYRYAEGSRAPEPDPEIEVIAKEVAAERGIERREITDEEILERCLYAAVNEGARIVGEGIALRASDIDVMWLYGFGFPRWRGGIMYHADTVGLPAVLARIESLEAVHGGLWTPAPYLRDCIAAGRTFTQD